LTIQQIIQLRLNLIGDSGADILQLFRREFFSAVFCQIDRLAEAEETVNLGYSEIAAEVKK